jgi:hypothetical protein
MQELELGEESKRKAQSTEPPAVVPIALDFALTSPASAVAPDSSGWKINHSRTLFAGRFVFKSQRRSLNAVLIRQLLYRRRCANSSPLMRAGVPLR